MKKIIKLSVIIATALIVAAILLFVLFMSLNNWDFKAFSASLTQSEFEIGESFEGIEINIDNADLVFLKSEDGKCKVVSNLNEKIIPSITNDDGKLVIESTDTRKWYERISLFSLNSAKITVYLPLEEYGTLNIDLLTGDTKIGTDLKFGAVSISATTGDVECYSAAFDALKINITTGDVSLSSLDITANLDIKTTTGEIKINGVTAKDININGTTGDVTLANTALFGNLNVDLTTGGVALDKFDAAGICINTTTGDITGTLLSDKIFFTDTTTGDIEVPKTVSGGTCQLGTTTGDIEIYIEK